MAIRFYIDSHDFIGHKDKKYKAQQRRCGWCSQLRLDGLCLGGNQLKCRGGSRTALPNNH